MIAGFSRDEILREALVGPRSALVPLPDTQIIERPGWWQIVTPSLSRGGMNEVACSELPENEADAIIDETLATYARLGIQRYRWSIGADPRPADLGERLARRGLQLSESLAMARSTADTPPESDAAITVERVTLANVDPFTSVMAEGWEADAAPFDALHRRILADPAGRNHLFLARLDGVPAATATYAALDRSAYLMGAVALPKLRGRGLYRALVHARLRDAHARGLQLATSVARADTSAPILARLGFETVSTIATYVQG